MENLFLNNIGNLIIAPHNYWLNISKQSLDRESIVRYCLLPLLTINATVGWLLTYPLDGVYTANIKAGTWLVVTMLIFFLVSEILALVVDRAVIPKNRTHEEKILLSQNIFAVMAFGSTAVLLLSCAYLFADLKPEIFLALVIGAYVHSAVSMFFGVKMLLGLSNLKAFILLILGFIISSFVAAVVGIAIYPIVGRIAGLS